MGISATSVSLRNLLFLIKTYRPKYGVLCSMSTPKLNWEQRINNTHSTKMLVTDKPEERRPGGEYQPGVRPRTTCRRSKAFPVEGLLPNLDNGLEYGEYLSGHFLSLVRFNMYISDCVPSDRFHKSTHSRTVQYEYISQMPETLGPLTKIRTSPVSSSSGSALETADFGFGTGSVKL